MTKRQSHLYDYFVWITKKSRYSPGYVDLYGFDSMPSILPPSKQCLCWDCVETREVVRRTHLALLAKGLPGIPGE